MTLLRLIAYDSLIDRCHARHYLDIELIFSLSSVSSFNGYLNSARLNSSRTCGNIFSIFSVTRGVVFEQKFNRLRR